MKLRLNTLLGGAGLLALTTLVQAQPTAHYVPGIEGIKGASLPPPGVYLRDYNVAYFSDRLNDSRGRENKPADAEAFIYANVPRVLWIMEHTFLGGYVGVDALLPLQYTSLEANTPGGPFDDSTFGIGDFFAESTLSWHTAQFDWAVAYGVWAPTGDSSANLTTRAGLGYWGHMFTAGATWYPDTEKKWAVSALNRYEINHEKRDTDITPGQAWTLEWGASYALRQTIVVGVAGYYQVQTTKDSGSGSSDERDHVVGVGPEVVAVCPALGVIFSLRYAYEVEAHNRLQGHTTALTLTKRF
jgi:hypothetical protein